MIECRAVSKWYGQVSALAGVSVSIESGVVGLVGRNGAGKSTLLKLLAGLLSPSQGEVAIGGRSPTQPAARRLLGFCPDVDRFEEHLAALDLVARMLRVDGVARAEARDRARHTLERLGLADAMRRPVRGFSKGMRQRVRLALALAHDPRVVLLDEPMTGLDPVARRGIAEQVHELAAAGAVVLISSHVLHELEELCSRVMLIHQGRLVADGSVAALRARLRERPYHLALRTRAPRELAARLTAIDVVRGIRLGDGTVSVETDGGGDLFRALTEIGAERDGLVDEIRPLDQDLESVFGYLVGGKG